MPTATITVVRIQVIENGDFFGAEWNLNVFANGFPITWTRNNVQDNTGYNINKSVNVWVPNCNANVTVTFGGIEADWPPLDPHDPLPVGVALRRANAGLVAFRWANRNASYRIWVRFTCAPIQHCFLIRNFIASIVSILPKLNETGLVKLGIKNKEEIKGILADDCSDEGEATIIQIGLKIMYEKGFVVKTMNDKHIIFEEKEECMSENCENIDENSNTNKDLNNELTE